MNVSMSISSYKLQKSQWNATCGVCIFHQMLIFLKHWHSQSLTKVDFGWPDWWISLVCLNPWQGTRGPNGEQRQNSRCPIATRSPVKAIMGNTERHSFNFILFHCASRPLKRHYLPQICWALWQGHVIQALGKCKLISY